MKVIYLASFKALHTNYDIVYQDINGKRDLGGDMLDIDLTPYDVIIATPPCNFYSKARGNRKPSEYALQTKHLLPSILQKCLNLGKPFLIENVINKKLMIDVIKLAPHLYFEHGRHAYFSNIKFDYKTIPQTYDYSYGGYQINPKNNQGGENVHHVIEGFLKQVKENSDGQK